MLYRMYVLVLSLTLNQTLIGDIPRGAPTCVTHELPGNFLVTAATAEDLTTQSAMVAATESSELFIAVITFFTLAVRHPVLLQVTVLKAGGHKFPN